MNSPEGRPVFFRVQPFRLLFPKRDEWGVQCVIFFNQSYFIGTYLFMRHGREGMGLGFIFVKLMMFSVNNLFPIYVTLIPCCAIFSL